MVLMNVWYNLTNIEGILKITYNRVRDSRRVTTREVNLICFTTSSFPILTSPDESVHVWIYMAAAALAHHGMLSTNIPVSRPRVLKELHSASQPTNKIGNWRPQIFFAFLTSIAL